MPFPTHLLTKDEDLVLDLRPHWWYLAPAGALLAVVTLVASPPCGRVGGARSTGRSCSLPRCTRLLRFTYLQWTTTNFVVTNERLVSRKGVISKEGIEIPLDRINTVFFNQSIFERIIGAGDLGIESAGEGGRQEFTDIRKPNLAQNEIYRQVEASRTVGSAASARRRPKLLRRRPLNHSCRSRNRLKSSTNYAVRAW